MYTSVTVCLYRKYPEKAANFEEIGPDEHLTISFQPT